MGEYGIHVCMEEEKKSRKRLVMNVSDNLHMNIKTHATRRNMTITQYVIESVLFRMQQDKEVD